MPNALPIKRLVNVQVNLSPKAAQMQDIATLLIMGSSVVIDPVERFRIYDGIDSVASDFGTSAPEYLAAALWFEQSPQPSKLQIGRWVSEASAAVLVGGLRSVENQNIPVWRAITNGGFDVTIDDVVIPLAGMDFSGVTNLNGVASVIGDAFTAAALGDGMGVAATASIEWNANYSRFELTVAVSESGSSVTFAIAPTTGGTTDVSGFLGITEATRGAYIAASVTAESAAEAVALFDDNYGQGFYAVTFIGIEDDDAVAVSQYIEAATNKHLHCVTTQDAATLSAVSTDDLAYRLNDLGYRRSLVQYSSTNPYAVCSLIGRALTVDYNGNSTVITLMYKQEPGIIAETMNETQITVLEDKSCNVFLAYNNNTAIIEPGVVSSGDFIDIITGTDWLALGIQLDIYNLLYTSTTKIPQTDAGNHMIATVIDARCIQAGTNGLLAPGVWNSDGFGSLARGDFLPKGFYVYAPPVGLQNQSDREARKSVLFQVAAKLAGAIHTVDVVVNVNR